MKKIHCILFVLFTNIFFAQESSLVSLLNPPPKTPETPDEIVCELPASIIDAEFVSGRDGLPLFIKTYLEYPKKAKRKKQQEKWSLHL
jgi:hypothetical protein